MYMYLKLVSDQYLACMLNWLVPIPRQLIFTFLEFEMKFDVKTI